MTGGVFGEGGVVSLLLALMSSSVLAVNSVKWDTLVILFDAKQYARTAIDSAKRTRLFSQSCLMLLLN